MSPFSIEITPPILTPWLSKAEKLTSLMLVDLEFDELKEQSIRLDLNVAFNCIPVRHGLLQRADHYVGTSAGKIQVEFEHGHIDRYTEGDVLNVSYCNKIKRMRNSSVNIEPKVSMVGDGSGLTASAGTLTSRAGIERTFQTTFQCDERALVPVVMDNLLTWTIDLPRGEMAVRDFIIGNLHLFVECTWLSSDRSGKIAVRPSDVRFFDADKRPVGDLRSITMLFYLWQQGIKNWRNQGFETSFRILA